MYFRPDDSRSQVMVILFLTMVFLLPTMVLAPSTSLAEEDDTGSRFFDITIVQPPELDEDEVYTFVANVDDIPIDVLETYIFQWDLGDGTTEVGNGLASISHEYPMARDYQIELTVTDEENNEHRTSTVVRVKNVVPVAEIRLIRQSTFEDEIVTFSADDSWDTVSDIPNLKYSWTLPGGSPTDFSQDTSIQGTFPRSGQYQVVLKVIDDDGAIGTTTSSFRVDNQPPLAIAGKDIKVIEGTEVEFTGTLSKDTISDINDLSYSWDFGDGKQAAGSDAAHTYTESGIFNAILTVTDDDGRSTVDQISVTVLNIPPVAKATIGQEGDGSFVTFDGSLSLDTASDMDTLGYQWIFEDGTVKNGQKVTHNFERTGIFEVILRVEDHEHALGEDKVDVTIMNMAPRGMIISSSIVEEDQKVILDATGSSDPDGSIMSYRWDLGDGTTGQGRIINHTYEYQGLYTVGLILVDDMGTLSVHEKVITVKNRVPEVKVQGSRIGSVGEEFVFNGSATDDTPSDIPSLEFVWDYGDGTVGHGIVVRHVFDTLGEYDVRLDVTDDDGAVGTYRFKVQALFEDYLQNLEKEPLRIDIFTDIEDMGQEERFMLQGRLVLELDLAHYLTVEDADVMVQIIESGIIEWTKTDKDGYFKFDLQAPGAGRTMTLVVVATVEPFIASSTFHTSIEPVKEAPPIIDPVVTSVSTASFALVAIGLIGGTDIGRWKFFTLMIPLFTRIVKPKVLDHFERGRIFEHVRKNPGDTYSSIRKTLGMKNGALAHHLRVLENHEYIISRRDGIYKRFYPKGMKVPVGTHKSIQERILDLIISNPNITQKEIAQELGIDRSTVNYHIKVLMAMSVIRSEKIGRVKHYFFVGIKDPIPFKA